MKKIIGYLREYFIQVDKRVLVLSVFFVALAIFSNYHFNLNHRIANAPEGWQYGYWFGVFLLSFSFPYLLYHFFRIHHPFQHRRYVVLLLIAPILFSWKMVYDIELSFPVASHQNIFWNQVIYWPSKLLVITTAVYGIWNWTGREGSFYGTSFRDFNIRPYALMLLIMLPLIAAASTQPDFLAMYPKLHNISFLNEERNSGWYKILFELSYGSDFFTIELFFRGFLILAFTKWFGRDAILPMACFYCTIHFGKPLGECISSFFGGMILGVVTYHTRTIFGGLMVHLGIAWLMELGGFLGHLWR